MPRPSRVSFARRFAKNCEEHEAGLCASPVRHRILQAGVDLRLRIRRFRGARLHAPPGDQGTGRGLSRGRATPVSAKNNAPAARGCRGVESIPIALSCLVGWGHLNIARKASPMLDLASSSTTSYPKSYPPPAQVRVGARANAHCARFNTAQSDWALSCRVQGFWPQPSAQGRLCPAIAARVPGDPRARALPGRGAQLLRAQSRRCHRSGTAR